MMTYDQEDPKKRPDVDMSPLETFVYYNSPEMTADFLDDVIRILATVVDATRVSLDDVQSATDFMFDLRDAFRLMTRKEARDEKK